jgi:hypothetical protein
VFGFFAALPFLCWILFDRSREIGLHDYSSLYASYKTTARQELTGLLYVFGLAVPTVFAAFILVARKVSPNRQLLFSLLVSSVIASLLFLQVQSPGAPHYYLLMPLLGAPLAALGIALYRSYGLLAPTVLTAVLVLGNAAATWARPAPRWIAAAFPSYAGWLPKTQPYKKGFVKLTRWLLGPESAQKRFCVVASSAEINQGVFYELWQIVPELKKGGFDTRMIQLGQVDSRADRLQLKSGNAKLRWLESPFRPVSNPDNKPPCRSSRRTWLRAQESGPRLPGHRGNSSWTAMLRCLPTSGRGRSATRSIRIWSNASCAQKGPVT